LASEQLLALIVAASAPETDPNKTKSRATPITNMRGSFSISAAEMGQNAARVKPHFWLALNYWEALASLEQHVCHLAEG
jgi:hypothetical protein